MTEIATYDDAIRGSADAGAKGVARLSRRIETVTLAHELAETLRQIADEAGQICAEPAARLLADPGLQGFFALDRASPRRPRVNRPYARLEECYRAHGIDPYGEAAERHRMTRMPKLADPSLQPERDHLWNQRHRSPT
jgi:hypothetical protein